MTLVNVIERVIFSTKSSVFREAGYWSTDDRFPNATHISTENIQKS